MKEWNCLQKGRKGSKVKDMIVTMKLDKPPAEVQPEVRKREPLAENRAGTIARVLEHKKVCVVLCDEIFEVGTFGNMHIAREYSSVHRATIAPGAKIPEMMFDGCMTITNMDVFVRMLSPGNKGVTEDDHGRTVTVNMEVRKDLIAIDGFEHLDEGRFARFVELLTAFKKKNYGTVIVASAAVDSVPALKQLDELLDRGLIDQVEPPKHGQKHVEQLDLICRGAMLVEKRQEQVRTEIAAHIVELRAEPDDVSETILVEPIRGKN